MILSVIDIGTNTILMVTLGVGAAGDVRVLGDEHRVARLGKGVDATRTILPATVNRVAGHLTDYRAIAEEHTRRGGEPGRIVAFGTSALRDAVNRAEFIAEIERRTGITIELLSGADEAAWTYRGALFGLDVERLMEESGSAAIAVVDIGGGSTEIATGDGRAMQRGASVDVGAVRISERHLPTLPADAGQIETAHAFARAVLEDAIPLEAGTVMVGVAGTVTTLGAISAGIEHFDADALNGTHLTRATIASEARRLAAMPVEAIAAIPQVHPDRADILPGGAIILDEVMRRYDLPSIIVSTRGVRYGIALREIERAAR